MESIPLIFIVGPTASGKTGLAIKIAQQYNGEVISADSRAIYKGMDIGSAKPTLKERQGVPHWGFDLVVPGERFTAADFQQYAVQKIAEVRARGHVPIIAGGTGLYINAVLFEYVFPPEIAPAERRKWEEKSMDDLYKYCADNHIILPENRHNKRYVINTILRKGHALKMNPQPRKDAIVVGIATERALLRKRITERSEHIFALPVVEESLHLAAKYGWDNEAMTGNIYKIIHSYTQGSISLEQAKAQFAFRDWQLAKRQLTWFKRNVYITWLTLDTAYTYLTRELDKLNNV